MRLIFASGVAAIILLGCKSAEEKADLELCERMIHEAATWGVLDIGEPETIAPRVYEWKRGDVVITNGFGAHISAEVSCFPAPDREQPPWMTLTARDQMTMCEVENGYIDCL